MKFRQFLEMPIAMKKIGDRWQQKPEDVDQLPYNRWDMKSMRALGSQKGQEKITRLFQNVPHDFNVYLVNNQGTDSLPFDNDGQRLEMNYANVIYKRLGITPQEAPILPNKINVFFVSWDQEPPTAWMIAHRFSHAIKGDFGPTQGFIPQAAQIFSKYTNTQDEQVLAATMGRIFTMRSARLGGIQSPSEGFREMLTQYIMTGQVTFQPDPQIPNLAQMQDEINQLCSTTMQDAHNFIHVF